MLAGFWPSGAQYWLLWCTGRSLCVVRHVPYAQDVMVDLSQGPDYRLCKSEPELTTVAEVDESNGEDKTAEQLSEGREKEPSSTKGALLDKDIRSAV